MKKFFSSVWSPFIMITLAIVLFAVAEFYGESRTAIDRIGDGILVGLLYAFGSSIAIGQIIAFIDDTTDEPVKPLVFALLGGCIFLGALMVGEAHWFVNSILVNTFLKPILYSSVMGQLSVTAVFAVKALICLIDDITNL